MASTSITRTYDAITSSTYPAYVKANFIDQISDEYPLLWWLMGENRGQKPNLPRSRTGRKVLPGGESIRIPTSYQLNTTTTRLASGYTNTPLTPQENETIAQLEWRQIAASVVISTLEKQKNQASRTQIIALLEERVGNARRAVMDLMSQDIHSDGTTSGQITGLQAAVAASGTYAQIVRGSNSWWNATVDSSHGAFDNDTLDTMTDNVIAATIGTDSPDLIEMATDDYRTYMDLIDDSKRFVNTNRGDARFQFLDFQGIPVIWDRDQTAGVMYFLNSNHVYFAFMRGGEIGTTPFVDGTPNGQLADISLIHMTGNLVCDEPRKTASITGIT